jgi:hypothetical protein
MSTLTITLNESLHNAIKTYANQHAISINQIIRDHFAQLTNIEPVKEIKTLKRFSEGEIGRLEAMKTLNIDYSTLLDRVGQQGLSLPTLPFNELEQMANQFVHILKEAKKP